MRITTIQQKEQWVKAYYQWENTWDEYLKERTDIDNPITTRKWGYTHRSLRSVRSIFRAALKENSLFTFLENLTTTPVNRTTSPLEGGINKGIKTLLRAHNGLNPQHARTAIEWYLNQHTRHPYDPWYLAKQQLNTPEPD